MKTATHKLTLLSLSECEVGLLCFPMCRSVLSRRYELTMAISYCWCLCRNEVCWCCDAFRML